MHGTLLAGASTWWVVMGKPQASRLWNVQVRLGVVWSGVEPEEGRMDPVYLEHLTAITRTLGRHGVAVLLDLHQVLLVVPVTTPLPGRRLQLLWHLRWVPCLAGGPAEGARQQPTLPLAARLRPQLVPRLRDPGGGGRLPGPPSPSSTRQALYDNQCGAADRMAAVWRLLATQLGNHTDTRLRETIG
jgi:hypothetical protein